MGILDSFERGLERAVNGAFARTFRSGLQPVEITAAIRTEIDTHAHPVARDRILVPNRFTARMSEADHLAMQAMGDGLLEELAALAEDYARQQHYQMLGPVQIELASDESLGVGMLEVDSQSERTAVKWRPTLEVNGTRYPLSGRVVIGRGSEADITLDDPGISRRHLEVVWDGKRAQANDLGSTNGSKLNGDRFTKALLPNDSVLEIGRSRIVFQLVAEAAGRTG